MEMSRNLHSFLASLLDKTVISSPIVTVIVTGGVTYLTPMISRISPDVTVPLKFTNTWRLVRARVGTCAVTVSFYAVAVVTVVADVAAVAIIIAAASQGD